MMQLLLQAEWEDKFNYEVGNWGSFLNSKLLNFCLIIRRVAQRESCSKSEADVWEPEWAKKWASSRVDYQDYEKRAAGKRVQDIIRSVGKSFSQWSQQWGVMRFSYYSRRDHVFLQVSHNKYCDGICVVSLYLVLESDFLCLFACVCKALLQIFPLLFIMAFVQLTLAIVWC